MSKTDTEKAPCLLGSGPASRRAGVSRDTLRRWAERGLVPAVRTPSGQLKFRPEDLDDLFRPAAEADA